MRRGLRFRPAGHAGQRLVAVALRGFMLASGHAVPPSPAPSFPFQAPADFKKNAPLSLLVLYAPVFVFYFLFFCPRVTLLDGYAVPEARRGTPETGDLHMVRSCCGNL